MANPSQPATVEAELPIPPEPKPVVLLVEDNRADVFMVEVAITNSKLDVQLEVLEDGEAAVDYFAQVDETSAKFPRLLLLDLNLPKQSGAEVLRKIRSSSRCQNLRVVVMTSSDSPSDRQIAERLGADAYFRKPNSYREYLKLGEVIEESLRRPRW